MGNKTRKTINPNPLFDIPQMRQDLHNILVQMPMDHKEVADEVGVERQCMYRFLSHKSSLRLKSLYKIANYIMKHKHLLEIYEPR